MVEKYNKVLINLILHHFAHGDVGTQIRPHALLLCVDKRCSFEFCDGAGGGPCNEKAPKKYNSQKMYSTWWWRQSYY